MEQLFQTAVIHLGLNKGNLMNEKETETIRNTFVPDTKMTPGIIRIIERIAKNAIRPIRERKQEDRDDVLALERLIDNQDSDSEQ